jgi:hypothetical protein
MKSATDIAQDTLEGREVGFPWIMHVKTDLLNSVGNIWSGEGEILESACKTPEICRVSHGITISR